MSEADPGKTLLLQLSNLKVLLLECMAQCRKEEDGHQVHQP